MPVALGARAYDIVIGRGLIAASVSVSRHCGPAREVAIVTDATVAKHHLAAAEPALEIRRRRMFARIVVPAGEGSKSYRNLRNGLRGDHRGAHRAR